VIRLLATAVAASLVAAGPARADEAPVSGPAPPNLAIYGLFGFATPVGFVGAEGVLRAGSWFEMSAGLGAGMTAVLAHSGSPLQWAVMPRIRVGDNDRNGLTLGFGFSGGNIGDIPLFCDEYCDAQRASYPTHYWIWANTEIGGEHWFQSGFALRYFGGYARGCQVSSCTSALGLPYLGVGFGRAF
jgi:hypothetical protein